MAIKANEQGIVYAGVSAWGMSLAYRPRGRTGYVPSQAECKRDNFVSKHKWNLHATIGGKNKCKGYQRNELWNGYHGWKYLLEIHSLPNEPLDIPPEIFINHMQVTAENIYQSNACLPKGLRAFLNVLNYFFIVIAAIVMVVAAVCISIVTAGGGSFAIAAVGTAMVWLSIALIPVTITTGITAAVFNTQAQAAQKAQNALKNNAGTKSLMSAKAKLAAQNNKISNLLMYHSKEIYAKGQIYEQGKAGSESFCYAQAYDAHKGLLGTLEPSQIDELCQNRNQVALAGGVSYMQNLLGVDFPLARVEIYNINMEKDKAMREIKEWYMRINSFLGEILKQGFYYGEDKSQTKFETIFERLENTHIKRRQRYLVNLLQLESLKNYNKGLRYEAPISTAEFSKSKVDTKSKYLQNFDFIFDCFVQSVDKYTPLEAQAIAFAEFIKKTLEEVNTFKNDSDKELALHKGSADFINARLRHSGDVGFRHYISIQKGNPYNDEADKVIADCYAGSSPKIPPFLLSDVWVVWGWVYKDIGWNNDFYRFCTKDSFKGCYFSHLAHGGQNPTYLLAHYVEPVSEGSG